MRRPTEFADYPPDLATRTPFGPYRAVVKAIIDGDTIDVFIDMGLNKYAYETVRLRGIDTPELRGGSARSRARARKAAAALAVLIPIGTPVAIYTRKDATTFGRYVAEVYRDDGMSISEAMQEWAA